MNKKNLSSIVTVLALSAASTLAAEKMATETSTPVAVVTSEEIASTPVLSIEDRLAALEASNKSAGWAQNVKIKGDLRYRYEDRDSDEPGTSDKSRQRFRARIGAYGSVNEQVDFGVRLATGSDESPTSTNQDVDGYGSKKNVWLDLAYMTVTCPVTGVQITFGKMKQPWEAVSDLVYDSDFNPEGINAGYELPFEDVTVTLNAGHFIFDENGGNDVQMTSGQIAADAKLCDSASLTFGLNTYIWDNPQDAIAGKGNTGAVDFNIVEGFAQVDLKETPLPVKLFGDYAQNMGTDVSKDTAWMVGVGTKIGKTSLAYNYRMVEVDSIYGDLADSDFHDGGTGGKGHKISAKYPLMKNLNAGATYFITETEAGNDVNTLQLDLVAKF